MENFNNLGLPENLLQSLTKMNFSTPTPVQAAGIPPALKGRDILGSAQTGTGKTGAFGIPLIAHLEKNKNSIALVVTPTRELAAQVLKSIQQMMSVAPVRTALLIGGDSMFKQLQQLKGRPRLIVGTPGRINDHLEQRTLDLRQTDFLVLDETDKMLDMGFEVQIDRIVKHIKAERQTLLFSATLPPYIVKLAEKYQKNPERIAVGSTTAPIAKINQEVVYADQSEKYNVLMDQLEKREGSIIVFVKTKHGADRLSLKLNKDGHTSDAIHGNLSQSRRTRVIESFRNKKFRIMVATDVAARGLDIPHIEHVVNYDLPQVPEDYIHRIGRTARAGKEGAAVCFVSNDEKRMWRDITYLMNPGEKPEITDLDVERSNTPQKKRRYGNRMQNRGKSFGNGAPRRDERGGERRDRDARPNERSNQRSNDRSSDRFSAPRGERQDRQRQGEGRFERKELRDSPFRSERRDERSDGRNRVEDNRGGPRNAYAKKRSYGSSNGRPASGGRGRSRAA